MTVLGYCPGTSVAACGEGRRDAMAGVVGMFAGALTFVVAWPHLQPVIKGLGNEGKVTIPDLTDTSPWLWIAGMTLAGIAGVVVLCGNSTGQSSVPQSGIRVGSGAET